MSRRCFLIVPPRPEFNINPLKEIGPLCIIYNSEEEHRPSLYSTEIVPHFLERIEKHNFNPKRDVFVGIGSAIQQVVATSALQLEYGQFVYLSYDHRINDYRRVVIGEPYECESSERLDEAKGSL